MKKRNIPAISGIRKKYIAAAVIAAVFLLIILPSALRRRPAAETVEENSIRYSLRWLGEEYEGTYTGKTVNRKPEGSGIFADSEGKLTYSGDWADGKPEGNGTIQYADGTHEEGTYINGKRHLWVRSFESDTEYKDGIYDFGTLYGCLSHYKDGKLKHETLIANGDHVSQIRKDAVKLTREVIEKKEYLDKYVYIRGKVVYLQETDIVCNYRIESDSIGMVIGNYTNTSGYRSAQPMMPNMELGETVTIYGFYTGTVRNELVADREYYEYMCVQIDPVFGEDASGDEDRGSYASISKNPYSYCGRIMTGEYVVEQYTKSGDLFYLRIHPEGAEEEQYYVRLDTDPDTVFYGGEEITIKGFIIGQRKTEEWSRTFVTDDGENLEISEYKKYPFIRAVSYELR